MDTSRGIRAKKTRYEIPVSGKDKVKKKPLVKAGKYLSQNWIVFLTIIHFLPYIFLKILLYLTISHKAVKL
jgi:hypothetical protein